MAVDTVKKEVSELSLYLRSMASRLKTLEDTSNQLSNRINTLSTRIKEAKQHAIKDKEVIKKELSCIKEDVRAIQKTTLQIINHLKNSVKSDEFERFKKRIDVWGPERFVTRREVKKVLKQL